VLLFVGAVGVLVALAQLIFFAPLDEQNRARRAAIQGHQNELAGLQKQLERVIADRDGVEERRARERVEALRAELAALQRTIAEEERAFTPPERMREVLERMIGPHARVSLAELKSLPVEPLVAAGDAKLPRPVYRHGVEFVLHGRYEDLYAWLRSLEALPTRVYWGRVELEASDWPVHRLRVKLHTISFDRAWLAV